MITIDWPTWWAGMWAILAVGAGVAILAALCGLVVAAAPLASRRRR